MGVGSKGETPWPGLHDIATPIEFSSSFYGRCTLSSRNARQLTQTSHITINDEEPPPNYRICGEIKVMMRMKNEMGHTATY